MAALALGREGIPVVVCEREPGPGRTLRASTFHPPTLDMLDAFGISKRLIEAGLIASTWQIRDRNTGPVATFDMSALAGDTGHPYRVQCEQWRLSEFLLDELRSIPHVELRFETKVTGITQDASEVQLETESPSGSSSLSGRWAIAADGAGSVLRRALGIEFEGFTYPERFLVVSTPFPFEEHLEALTPINYVSDPEEWLVLLRVPGLWRVLFPTSQEMEEQEVLDPARIEASLQKLQPNPQPYEIAHQALYPIHQRVAQRYRAERVFLVGDAAHINNPLGGMGLNGGIHDALCLADRMAAVWRGTEDTLLDQYERKRRPIAIDYVKQATMRNRQLMEERDPEKRAAALADMRASAEDPERAREVMLRASMISAVRRAEALD